MKEVLTTVACLSAENLLFYPPKVGSEHRKYRTKGHRRVMFLWSVVQRSLAGQLLYQLLFVLQVWLDVLALIESTDGTTPHHSSLCLVGSLGILDLWLVYLTRVVSRWTRVPFLALYRSVCTRFWLMLFKF